MALRHYSTFKFDSVCLEVADTESNTEPDMSYSIKELLARFGVGNTPPVAREVAYDELEDEDMSLDGIPKTESPDFDLADAFTLGQQLQQNRERFMRVREKFRQQTESRSAQNATTINDDVNSITEPSQSSD